MLDVYTFLVSSSWVLPILYIIWYLFFTDSDTILAVAEKFGRPVSSFSGKVVWITGASTGLGEAMAHELASVGGKLILSARSEDVLQKVKDECLEISQGKLKKRDILVLPFDVSNFESHKTHVDNAINHFGKIDVLVSNAGRYQIGPISTTQIEVEKDLFDVNFFGGVSLTKLLVNHFLKNGKGHIVVISSIAGKFGIPSIAPYVATKHAIQGYYDALRMEYNKNRIAVTIVCPGIFKSAIFGRTMTEKKGEIFQKASGQYECKQMTSARCAHLTLVATANKLFEAWVAYQPFMLMMWLSQYCPDIYKYIMLTQIYTKRRVAKLSEGIWPSDLPVWKPLFR